MFNLCSHTFPELIRHKETEMNINKIQGKFCHILAQKCSQKTYIVSYRNTVLII